MLPPSRFVCSSLLLVCLPSIALAGSITSTSGKKGLGQYEGSFDYSASSSSSATLVITLRNTTPVQSGGYLTAFAFNNPNNAITDVSLSSTNANFQLLKTSDFQDDLKASPYGRFDIGAGLGKKFNGGGKASDGLAPGDEEVFTFTFEGDGLDTFDEEDFALELSKKPKKKETARAFVARFRKLEKGGSETVPGIIQKDCHPGTTPPGGGTVTPARAPEPSSLALASIALGCLFAHARRRRAARLVP